MQVADNPFGNIGDKVLAVPGGGTAFGLPLIDGAEWARFDFDAGAALNVSLRWQSLQGAVLPSPNFSVEGFDTVGNSLGTVGFTGDPLVVDVSGQFGGISLSAFRLLGGSPQAGINVASVTFTPTAVAATAPEPATGGLALFTLGAAYPLGAAAGWRRRRR